MYYVYILQLKNKQLYCGFTSDINRRIKEHKAGKSPFTKKRLPIKLIFFEAFNNKLDAEKRERYFKTSKGKASLQALLRNTFSHK